MTEGRFEGERRVHIGLAISDLSASIGFYETLLGVSPIKVRDGYAKFETDDPSLNLSMHVVKELVPPHPRGHFGIQVKTADAVKLAGEQLSAAEVDTRTEEAIACCYAVQDKVWATDPDGHSWEVFVVLDASSDVKSPRTIRSECCDEEPGCCESPDGCC